MSDPTDRKSLPRGACGFHRSDGSYCTKPQEFKLIFFHFSEGTAPETRHRITVCRQHLGRTVFRVATRYKADKITIFPRTAPETAEEAGAEPADELLEEAEA
ncbi:MAG TPA: hypothetical protein VGJ60_07395 [Chloroflexota bacterium]|jgi:hypothetical protein